MAWATASAAALFAKASELAMHGVRSAALVWRGAELSHRAPGERVRAGCIRALSLRLHPSAPKLAGRRRARPRACRPRCARPWSPNTPG